MDGVSQKQPLADVTVRRMGVSVSGAIFQGGPWQGCWCSRLRGPEGTEAQV